MWRAPGRVTVVGDHTDYAGGLSLACAIDRSTLVAGAPRDDGRLTCVSRQADDDGAAGDWTLYPEGVRRAAVRRGLIPSDAGADLLVDSDVPLGAGLSSSAALTVATAGVLLDLSGATAGRSEVAQLCAEAENVTVGAPTGLLDQRTVLFAEPDRAVLLDFATGDSTAVDLCLSAHALLVVDSGVRHAHADGAYGDRRRAVEQAAARLGLPHLGSVGEDQLGALPQDLLPRARHVVTENARVRETARLLEAGRVDEVGPVLTASHRSLRDDHEVSCPELDAIVQTALEAGAVGARMAGGGFGGNVLVLVRRGDATQVRAAVAATRPGAVPAPLPRRLRPSAAAHRC